MHMTPPPTLLDAAMGTRLIEAGLDIHSDDDACLWCISRPEAVLANHLADLHAGSRILTTNTFGANSDWLSRFGRSSDDMIAINRQAVALAKHAFEMSGIAGKIIGSIGPTALVDEKTTRQQMNALLDSGADILLFETCTASQATQAAEWVEHATDHPVWITLWNWGEKPVEIAGELQQLGISDWGINCISDIEQIANIFRELKDHQLEATILRPSDLLPSEFANLASKCKSLGGLYFGGCCGTTSEHISALDRLFNNGSV
jgi:methionine synthase I (cobalamin-dependent)